MSQFAVRVEQLGKRYRLGLDHAGSVREWLHRATARLRRGPRRQAADDGRQAASQPFWALQDVSFEVGEGDVLGIIGPNGAGKSTLLKILSGITRPTCGRALIRGRVGSLLEVGTGFHPELTGRENVFLNGAILGMSRREIARKFDAIADFSGVEPFLDTPVKRYSTGMRVRLGFAVAAHLEPEVLIIDEVLAVGDAAFQRKCLGAMSDVAGSGRTVLFVSHNMSAVEALCGRALLLEQGRVTALGGVEDVVRQYRHSVFGEAAATSLLERHEGLIRRAELLDADEQPAAWIPLGGEFHLRVDLALPCESHHLRVVACIDDVLGQRLLTLSSPPTSPFLSVEAGTYEFHCRVRHFPLAAGEYRLKLAVADGQETVDVVEHAMSLHVAESDAFGAGTISGRRGLCVAPAEWWSADSGDTDDDSDPADADTRADVIESGRMPR